MGMYSGTVSLKKNRNLNAVGYVFDGVVFSSVMWLLLQL